MLMIELTPLSNGAHRNQSGSVVSPPPGWAIVPPALEREATSYLPFIDLDIEGGKIVGVSQGVIPDPEPEPVPEPTELEKLRADVDFLSAMTGIDL